MGTERLTEPSTPTLSGKSYAWDPTNILLPLRYVKSTEPESHGSLPVFLIFHVALKFCFFAKWEPSAGDWETSWQPNPATVSEVDVGLRVGVRDASTKKKVGVGDGVGVGVLLGGGVELAGEVGGALAAVCVDAAAAVCATIVSTAPGTGDGIGAAGGTSEARSQLITRSVSTSR